MVIVNYAIFVDILVTYCRRSVKLLSILLDSNSSLPHCIHANHYGVCQTQITTWLS